MSKVSGKLPRNQDDLPGISGARGYMTEITAENVGEFMRSALEELGTPPDHRGALSAKALLRNAAIALRWPPRRVRAYWHGEVANPSAVEYLQAQARLHAHRQQIEERAARCAEQRVAFEAARSRFVETHPALGRLAPPSLSVSEDGREA